VRATIRAAPFDAADQASYLVRFEAKNARGSSDRPTHHGKSRSLYGRDLDRGRNPSLGNVDLERSCEAGPLDCDVSLHGATDLVRDLHRGRFGVARCSGSLILSHGVCVARYLLDVSKGAIST